MQPTRHLPILLAAVFCFGLWNCDGSKIPNQEKIAPDTIATGKDGSTIPDGSTLPEEAPTSTEKVEQPEKVEPEKQTTPDDTKPEPLPEKADPGGLGVTRQALSGSRLKIRFIQGVDGSKQFLGWHDTMLNTPCTWRAARDIDSTFSNKSYCVPNDMLQGIFGSGFYTDANCTKPLFKKAACTQSTLYGQAYATSGGAVCTSQVSCYGVSPYKDESVYIPDGSGACKPFNPSTPDQFKNGTYYTATTRCTEQSFFAQYAEGEVKIEP